MKHYLDEKDNLVMLTFFYDAGAPYSNIQWGSVGDARLPLMVDGGVFNTSGGLDQYFFGNDATARKNVFINKDFEIHSLHVGEISDGTIMEILNDLIK